MSSLYRSAAYSIQTVAMTDHALKLQYFHEETDAFQETHHSGPAALKLAHQPPLSDPPGLISVEARGDALYFQARFPVPMPAPERAVERVESPGAPPTWSLRFLLEPDEHLFALTAEGSSLTWQQGNLFSEERLEGLNGLSPLPFCVSSRGYLLASLSPGVWSFTQSHSPGLLEVQLKTESPALLLITSGTLRGLLGQLTALLGRPGLLAYRHLQPLLQCVPSRDDILAQLLKSYQKQGFAPGGLLLNEGWSIPGTLIPSPDFTEHPGTFGRYLRESRSSWGLSLPSQWHVNGPPPLPLPSTPERSLPRDAQLPMALDRPEGVGWFGQLLGSLLKAGVSFFRLPALPQGLPDRELLANAIANATSEVLEERAQRRPLLLNSTFAPGMQSRPAYHLELAPHSFEQLREALRGALQLSLLGNTWLAVGASLSPAALSTELGIRVLQWALLSPLCVLRDAPLPPTESSTEWATLAAQTKLLPEQLLALGWQSLHQLWNLRTRLLPTLYQLAQESSQQGIPVLRPLCLEFPQEELLRTVADQYLLGDRILIAPILEEGARGRELRLPSGVWHDYWTGQMLRGPGLFQVSAPLTRLPCLIRGGSILYFAPVLPAASRSAGLDMLEIHAWSPWPARGNLYEDDGSSLSYQEGDSSLFRCSVESIAGQLRIRLSPLQGAWKGMPARRALDMVLHGLEPPRRLLLRGKPLEESRYDSETRSLRIPLFIYSDEETLVTLSYGP